MLESVARVFFIRSFGVSESPLINSRSAGKLVAAELLLFFPFFQVLEESEPCGAGVVLDRFRQ